MIAVRHPSTSTIITFDLTTDVDATLFSSQVPTRQFSVSDGSGRIDLLTNGAIVAVETIGDLLVGTIESTGSNVTLTASDSGASIVDVIDDGAARVIGNTVTLTANGTIGRVDPIANPLEIRSSNSARGTFVATAPLGVFVSQVTGNLILGSVVAANGNVSLASLDGSILNDVDNGVVRVTGNSIDLIAIGGRVGTAGVSADIVIDTAADGRLLADGEQGVFVTEASGSLNVLLATASDGAVRITVPYVAGAPSESITLLPTGISVDGTRVVAEGGVDASETVELRAGNDVWAPLGTRITGAMVIVRTAHGQNPSAPVATTASFGGAISGTATNATIEVFGGYGNDTVVFFETVLNGQTVVYGGPSTTLVGNDGDDTVVITRITIVPGTHLGTAADEFFGLPVANSLRVDGQNGSNHVEVTVWGIDDPEERETRIEVVGTGTDPFAINTLTVNAGDGNDVVLLRVVAFVPGLVANRPAVVAVASGDNTVERISYDRSVNGKLTVNGLGGNDTFVLDDTSSPLTVNGGEGDDTFIVGQFFETERTAPNVSAEDAFPTLQTDSGWLSPGISRPAVLYGGAGNDRFVVNANQSELRLEGGTGDNEFVFVTSTVTTVVADTTDPADTSGTADPAEPTTVTEYVEHGFVSIDGGSGSSSLTVVAANPAAVVFDSLWWTVVGAGLALDLYGFTSEPVFDSSAIIPQAVGLPGEDGVQASLSTLPVGVTPPYVFAGRGDASPIIITETGGWTNVHPDGPLTDSYTIRLATAALSTVYITITSAFGGGSPFALFSIDGGLNWLASVVLAIAAGDLSEHEVLVRWADSAVTLADLPSGSGVVTLSHTVASSDPAFDGIDVRNVYVNLFKEAVVEPDVPSTIPTGLAATGAESLPTLWFALLLLLLGTLLLPAARRRRGLGH